MIIFVSICNILAAIGILVIWILESKSLPRAFVLQMSLRYVRFYLVYALMMNRFIRYSLWSADNTGTTSIPYWPLTLAEIVILIIYLVLFVINLVLYSVAKVREEENDDEIFYRPFTLFTVYYPVLLPSNKITKNKYILMILKGIAALIWMLGLFNMLATAVFAIKNVS